MARPRGNDVSIGTIAGTENSLVFPRTSRDKHFYVAGATGTGKSKFLEHLIRQDIRSWYKSRSGMLILDPHGSLFDSVIEWLAQADVGELPIIPIDLRQDDWVVSYNALRRRDVPDPSVIIDNFVQAMAHVWGQSGTDRTPLFERWATNILRTLYENDLTLLESNYLIDHLDQEARRVLMKNLNDPSTKRDWESVNGLRPAEFEAALGSTINRLRRFLQNPHMRNIFGHSSASLDLRKALDEGHIIIVSLATAKARVSQKDANLFATLLLSDLWTAALERGKRDDVKPFYLYLDEFQRFVTPEIASNLDEARGFGLHLTMAHQFPLQLLNQGPEGTKLYHSIMENASSKAVFRLHSEENLRPLAQWLFRGVMNPDQIKHTLEATKVMGHEEVERISRTKGRTSTASTTEGHSDSTMSSRGESESGSESRSASFREDEYGRLIEEPLNITTSDGESSGNSTSSSVGYQESISNSESEATSESETVSTVLIPIYGKEISHVQFRSLEEQLHGAMAALFDQNDRRGVVRLVGMKAPVSIETPTIRPSTAKKEKISRYVAKILKKWDFALPSGQAASQLAEREGRVEAQLRKSHSDEEPTTARRRIVP